VEFFFPLNFGKPLGVGLHPPGLLWILRLSPGPVQACFPSLMLSAFPLVRRSPFVKNCSSLWSGPLHLLTCVPIKNHINFIYSVPIDSSTRQTPPHGYPSIYPFLRFKLDAFSFVSRSGALKRDLPLPDDRKTPDKFIFPLGYLFSLLFFHFQIERPETLTSVYTVHDGGQPPPSFVFFSPVLAGCDVVPPFATREVFLSVPLLYRFFLAKVSLVCGTPEYGEPDAGHTVHASPSLLMTRLKVIDSPVGMLPGQALISRFLPSVRF